MVLFDIGAHFGIFSLAAACCGGTAVAVDPSPIAVHMVKTLAKLNFCDDRVRVVQAAVGETSSRLEILSAGVFSDGYYRVIKPLSRKDGKQVSSISLDQITEKYGTPTHVKIDVEGHELEVLRGARHTLSKHSPIVFIELHNQMIVSEGREPGQTLDELKSLGYAMYFPNGHTSDQSIILQEPIARLMAIRVPEVIGSPDI